MNSMKLDIINCARNNKIIFSNFSLQKCKEENIDPDSIHQILSRKDLLIVQHQKNYKGQKLDSYTVCGKYAKEIFHAILLKEKDHYIVVTIYRPQSSIFTKGGTRLKSNLRKRLGYDGQKHYQHNRKYKYI